VSRSVRRAGEDHCGKMTEAIFSKCFTVAAVIEARQSDAAMGRQGDAAMGERGTVRHRLLPSPRRPITLSLCRRAAYFGGSILMSVL